MGMVKIARRSRWLPLALAFFFASSLLSMRGAWIGFLTHGGAQVAAALGESGLARYVVGLSGTAWSASLQDDGIFNMNWGAKETPEREVVQVGDGIVYAVYDYGRKYYLTTDQYQVVCSAQSEVGSRDVERMLASARDQTATSGRLVRQMLSGAALDTYSSVTYYATNHGGFGIVVWPFMAAQYVLLSIWIPFWTVFPVSWISSAATASVVICWVGLAASIVLLLKRAQLQHPSA